MSDLTNPPRQIGLMPWFPWPLSASPWWTVPVRAERLAILRIGVAAVLLWDILQNYLPAYNDFYSDEGMMPPRVLFDAGRTPAWAWSILRGVADPLTSTLALLAFLGSTVLVLLGLGALVLHPRAKPPPSPLRIPMLVWMVSAVVWVMGVWARLTPPGAQEAWLLWATPALACGLASTFAGLSLWHRCVQPGSASGDGFWAMLTAIVALVLLAVGIYKWSLSDIGPTGPAWLTACFQRFDGDPDVIFWTMIVWLAAAGLLLVGFLTRISAVLAWLLTLEIMHQNFLVGNGGDVVRVILLFYLMLCPCGATWSIDAWWQRRRTAIKGGYLVPPWPLRLLFVQMSLIYFLNGLYKIAGQEWRDGTILYYVLNDPTLTRVAFTQFPVPLWILKGSAWLVLGWELGFPLWMALPWTRQPALAIGILFHIGIFVSMELGAFQLYMLTLYLPLLLGRMPGEETPNREVNLGLERAAS